MGQESEIPADTELLRAFLKELWTVLFILEPGFQRDEGDYFHLNLQDWAWENDKCVWQPLWTQIWDWKRQKLLIGVKYPALIAFARQFAILSANVPLTVAIKMCKFKPTLQPTISELVCFSNCHSNSLAVGMALKWFLHLHDSLTWLKGEDQFDTSPPLLFFPPAATMVGG